MKPLAVRIRKLFADRGPMRSGQNAIQRAGIPHRLKQFVHNLTVISRDNGPRRQSTRSEQRDRRCIFLLQPRKEASDLVV